MLGTYLTALIRTLAGYVAGLVVTLPVAPAVERAAGVTSATAAGAIAAGLTFGIGTAYYAGARLLERRWPAAGVLLGVPVAPTYERTAAPARHELTPAAAIADAAGVHIIDGEAPPAPSS